MSKPIEIILAATINGEIGYKNTIPWRLRGDLQRFKEITMGAAVIIGKNTYESLPNPLTGRTVIVVSSRLAASHATSADEVHFVADFASALALANTLPNPRVFVAGGVALYQAAFEIASLVHLTLVHQQAAQYDAAIPNFDLSGYQLVSQDPTIFTLSSRNLPEVSHSYLTYRRTFRSA